MKHSGAEKLVQRAMKLSVALGGLTLLVYAYIGTFMRLFGDDYCIAQLGISQNPLEVTIARYFTWNGRYADSFIQQMLNYGRPAIHQWFPAFIIVLLLLATYYFVSQLVRLLSIPLSTIVKLVITVLLTFTFMRLLPSYQHIYWLAAVIPYTLSLALLILWGGTLLHYFAQPRSTGVMVIFLIWSALMMFLIGGLTEAIVIALGLWFFIMLLASPMVSTALRNQYLIIVFMSGVFLTIALIILVVSPGAWARRNLGIETDGASLSMLEAMPRGFLFSLAYLFGEFVGITFGQTYGIAFLGGLFIIGLLWGSFYLEQHPEIVLPAPAGLTRAAILTVIIALLLTFAVIYPVVYAGRGNLPSRPLSITRLIQLVMVIVLLYFALAAAQRHHLLRTLRRTKSWSILLIAISFLVIWIPATSIYRLAIFVPDFSTYARQWDERHQYLLAQPDGADVIYEGFDYYIDDEFLVLRAADDSAYYVNRCMAGWYRINSFKIEGGVEPPEI